MTIPALFNDGKAASPQNATLELDETRLNITTPGAQYLWDYAGVEVLEKPSKKCSGKLTYDGAPNMSVELERKQDFKKIRKKLSGGAKIGGLFSVVLFLLVMLFALFYLLPAVAPSFSANIPLPIRQQIENYAAKNSDCTSLTEKSAFTPNLIRAYMLSLLPPSETNTYFQKQLLTALPCSL